MTLQDQYDDLDGLLAGPEPDWDGEPEAPAGVDVANGMLRTLGRLRRELTEAEELAAAEHARVDLWLSLQAKRIGDRTRWLETALALWHAGLLAEDKRRKTVQLPNGTLVARAQPYEWRFEPEFLAWATENAPDLLRHKPAPAPEIDKAAAKKAMASCTFIDGRLVTEHGEVMPGVTVVERGPRYTATPET